MTLTLSDDLIHTARLTGSRLLDELTLAPAARMAEVDRIAFQRLPAGRRIPLRYGPEEFKEDLRTLRSLPSV